jgi:AAHS family 4-hydroxybenzoate transporter-like MFS transporter
MVMLFDGLDLAVITYAAPALMKAWSIPPKMFGVVFSAAIFGIMVGSFLFGYLGDRLGRKTTLLISTAWFSVFTLATIWAWDYDSLLVLRFIAGVGLGGAVPQAIVLVSEFAPKGSGAKWVTVMFTGFSVGAMAGGLLAAWLLPIFGWEALFVVGGVVPMLWALIAVWQLPESMRFLSLDPRRRDQLAATVRRIKPGIEIGPKTSFRLGDERRKAKGSAPLKELFSGVLLVATPMIWMFYIVNSISVFFLKSWFPVLFGAAGFSVSEAALATAWFSFGGLVGGLCVGWCMDKFGMRSGTLFPLAGTLITGTLGYASGLTLTTMVFFVGFFVVGTQYIITAITPQFYPTSIRSNADGMAIGIAKIGSIGGPAVGGLLIGMNMPPAELFMVVAIPVAVVTVLCFVLTTLYIRHYMAPAAAAAPSAPATAQGLDTGSRVA